MSDSIVITGMGIFSPIGCNADAFWDSLHKGRSGAGEVDCIDTRDLSRKIACQIREPIRCSPDPNPERERAGRTPLPSRERGRGEGKNLPTQPSLQLGRAAQLAIAAARQALADASLNSAELSSARTSVTIGTTMGETQFIEDRLTGDAGEWLTPDHMREILSGRPGSIANHVCQDLGITVPACDLYGACAAGNMAIAAARRQLLDGRCDIVLAGGSDGFSRLAFLGFMRLRVMATEVCRPFDQRRDGLFVGEGAAVFVLERESSARARGARIHSRILGASVASENYHPTRPHPDGDGLTRSTLAALAEAGLDPGEIDYVCAHGTGTPQNDAIEVAVLDKCFPKGVAFSSIKSLTGHTMGAAAAVEAVACVLSLKHQTLIPTWHLDNVLQPCGQDAIKGSPRPAKLRHALNNSAGFGGYNSSIILAAP